MLYRLHTLSNLLLCGRFLQSTSQFPIHSGIALGRLPFFELEFWVADGVSEGVSDGVSEGVSV